MLISQKLQNQFQPNFTQLFFRAMVTILLFNYSGLFGTIRAGIQKHIEANFVTNFDTLLLPFAEHKLSPLILYVCYSNVMIT